MASSAVTLPLLDVSDLTIRRESSYVLSKVNWSVRKGEHWVILGANGSGKTSLLKAIAGYMPPTDGDISVLGETFGSSDWRELRKRIGVVSASISHLCHDEDPALEIVAGGLQAMIGLWGQLREGDEKKALASLGLVRARYLANRRWEVLSQGERQKVLIARALISAPPLLILDEPCSGLDPVARERFLQDLRHLAAKRTAPAIILVTHHIEEVLPECTHLLALKDGKVGYSGPIAEGLTSATLSRTFSAKMRVRRSGDRYSLHGLAV